MEDDGDVLLEIFRRHQTRGNQFHRQFAHAFAVCVFQQHGQAVVAHAPDGIHIAKNAFDFDDGAQQGLLDGFGRKTLAHKGQIAHINQYQSGPTALARAAHNSAQARHKKRLAQAIG